MSLRSEDDSYWVAVREFELSYHNERGRERERERERGIYIYICIVDHTVSPV